MSYNRHSSSAAAATVSTNVAQPLCNTSSQANALSGQGIQPVQVLILNLTTSSDVLMNVAFILVDIVIHAIVRVDPLPGGGTDLLAGIVGSRSSQRTAAEKSSPPVSYTPDHADHSQPKPR